MSRIICRYLALFLYSTIVLSSCNDPYQQPLVHDEVMLVGNWFTEDEISKMYAEYTYTADNSVFINEYQQILGYKRIQRNGSYRYAGSALTLNTKSYVSQYATDAFEVEEITELTYRTKSIDYGIADYYRIVGLEDIAAGTTKRIDVLKYIEAFVRETPEILNYQIADNSVANIDESGALTAKQKGVTYLSVTTTQGTAVIKVSVNDPDNLWKDCSVGIGESMRNIEEKLGKYYAYKSSDSIQYLYDDYYINNVKAFSHGDRSIVDSIVVTFNDNVDSNESLEFLRNKLIIVKDGQDDVSWFTDNTNYLLSKYSARYHKKNKTLIYTFCNPEWEDKMEDYGLTIEELTQKYGYHSPYKDLYFINIGEEFATEVYYFLNNGKVYQYGVFVNFDVTTEMINDYISRKFQMDNVGVYKMNRIINGQEMLVRVSFDKNDHRIYYYFDKNL